MFTTNLRKVGGSVMLTVPPAILETLHLKTGSIVAIAVEGNRLVVEVQARPAYTLDALLAQCDPKAPLDDDDRDWTQSAPSGHELI